jgi:hypothetical protein
VRRIQTARRTDMPPCMSKHHVTLVTEQILDGDRVEVKLQPTTEGPVTLRIAQHGSWLYSLRYTLCTCGPRASTDTHSSAGSWVMRGVCGPTPRVSPHSPSLHPE